VHGVPASVTVQQGVHAVAVAVGLGSATDVTVPSGAELWLTGEVSGSANLVKGGEGRLLLSGTNTYTGGTEVKRGAIEVAGSGALSTGSVVFNGGHLAAKGATTAVVPNDVSALQPVYLGTYAPLLLSGDWMATGDIVYYKIYTNELTVSGMMRPSAGAKNRMEIRDGAVRFAAGADAVFSHATVRESIDFSVASSGSVVRRLTVEPGAQVTAGCLVEGYGATNTVSVTGGSLMLQGAGTNNDSLLVGTGDGSANRFLVAGGGVTAADGTWSLLGVNSGQTRLEVGGGSVSLGKVSLGVRDLTASSSGTSPMDVFIRVAGGLLEARQGWNWMSDLNGARLNTVALDGGRMRLPATYATVSNYLNQTRMVFNGGTLETPGGGVMEEDPADYLRGLKQAYVGAGGAVVDTLGRSVSLPQRLTALSGAADGGVVKRGFGTLALSKPPCVTGRIDVQSGTLQLQPDTGTVYPDDPMVRFSFENGIQTDDSAYRKNAGTLTGNTNSLVLIAGKSGNNALRFNGANVLYVNYSDDMKNADSYTVSAWVRQEAYGMTNQRRTFFGTLDDTGNPDQYDFLLRVMDGDFRLMRTGPGYASFGSLFADVTNAVPLNTWTLLTYVVDGLNGFSMYVNGERCTMRMTGTSFPSAVYTNTFGAGKTWMFLPDKRVFGNKAFNIGTISFSDSEGLMGDLDDVTVYRRALSESEIAMLYQAKVPYGKRVRVQSGASLHLSGAPQEVAEVTGEGSVVSGTLVVSGMLNPGDAPASAAGALLRVTDNLTLGTNMTYICNWTPGANDLVEVGDMLTVAGAGTIDLGLALPSQMPGSPRLKSIPVMYYAAIGNAANLSQWRVTGIGRTAAASVIAADGVVWVNLDVPSGTLMLMK